MARKGGSLESLIESADIGVEVLHPGGLELTAELAGLCRIAPGSRVIDVASGTGESACYLAERFHCRVTGVDMSDFLLEKARKKAREKGLDVRFLKADAHSLPFPEGSFDAAVSECTLCLLDKPRAIGEMVRVVRGGGHVGMSDVSWRPGTPEKVRRKLLELEGESPETLQGWAGLFREAGLVDCVTVDRSELLARWVRDMRKRMGVSGQARVFLKVLFRWGFPGLARALRSERIFLGPHAGYGIVACRKP
ncbi:MAG: methyltransferase domain-containing protein [Nitrospirota bacterium]